MQFSLLFYLYLIQLHCGIPKLIEISDHEAFINLCKNILSVDKGLCEAKTSLLLNAVFNKVFVEVRVTLIFFGDYLF